ncbi:hypothetical protein [Nocardia sp. CY41]|uniref:hypothetical protein n=1 Tax=Nocardia sp. CY41 TaxID=2608686 RepID=UPI001359424F|nr:hypothetical protein [Nocardia sp. CY41]
MTRSQLMACRIGTIIGALALVVGIVVAIVDFSTVEQICTPHTAYFGRPDGVRCRDGDPSPRGFYLAILGVVIVVCTFIMWAAMTPRKRVGNRDEE